MDVVEAIQTRRALRSLRPVTITDEMVDDLATCAGLSASCFNNQPWHFVFVRDAGQLERLKDTLSKGNDWARSASMLVAVFSKKDDDCVIGDREYHLFDTGMASAHLILRATEMGLVAHPIAGFSQRSAREVLSIPNDYTVIALVVVGKRSRIIGPDLSPDQVKSEKKRPERKPPDEFAHHDRFNG